MRSDHGPDPPEPPDGSDASWAQAEDEYLGAGLFPGGVGPRMKSQFLVFGPTSEGPTFAMALRHTRFWVGGTLDNLAPPVGVVNGQPESPLRGY